MNIRITPNFLFWLSAILAGSSLLIALGMTAFLGLEPCHLCTIQRFFYALITCTSIAGILMKNLKRSQYIWPIPNILWTLLGLLFAGRQIWLQHLPPGDAPACLPSFSTLLTLFSPLEALLEVFKGSGDCAKIDWSFLGLNIAEYSLILFFTLLAINIYTLFFTKKYR